MTMPHRHARSIASAAAAVLAALLAGAPAHAQNQPAAPLPARGQMVEWLSGVEHEPELATVRAWGPRGARTLMEIGVDDAAPMPARIRAVHALRAFGAQPAVRLYLRGVASAPRQPVFVLRAALEALVEGFDDVGEVARFLRDRRVEVRDGAAWALSRSRTQAARTALAAALRAETDPTVRRTLQSALQQP